MGGTEVVSGRIPLLENEKYKVGGEKKSTHGE